MTHKSHKTYIITFAVLIALIFAFSQTAVGKRVFLEAGVIEAVRNFFAGNPELHACDYRDGTIILIKPVATGVGEGRAEAGDIVEVRDGVALCKRFGNGDPLGRLEKTKLLPFYYPAHLTEEQKRQLTEQEYKDGENTEIIRHRKVGIDYTQFLSDSEVLKIRSLEGLNKIPEIDLSSVIQKTTDQKSVVQIPQHLVKRENFRNSVKSIVRKVIPFAYAQTGGTTTICTSGCDYTTLNGWEDGEEGVLSEPAIAQITEAFTDGIVTIDGWGTNATNYIKVYTTADARHNGTAKSGGNYTGYAILLTAHYANAITVADPYVWIDGLILDGNYPNYAYNYGLNGYTATSTTVSNNIGLNFRAVGSTNDHFKPFYTGSNSKIYNNIAHNNDVGFGNRDWATGAVFYNNTAINNGTAGATAYGSGFLQVSAYGSATWKNNLASSTAGFPDFKVGSGVVSYSASVDGTADDFGGSNNRVNQTFTFVDATNGDFHLASNDEGAKDYGLSDPGSGLFSDDIDGETRQTNATWGFKWDIGADEATPRITGIGAPKTNFMNDDSLVGYWSFDGAATNWTSATAGTTNDLSGNGNTGTMTNMSRSSSPAIGVSGQALNFDGVNNYITANSVLTGNFTMSAWVKIPDKGRINYFIKGMSGSTERYLWTMDNSAGVYNGMKFYNGTSWTTETTARIDDNKWHFVAYTGDGTNITAFVDGVQDVQNQLVNPPATDNIQIGRRDSFYIRGNIDEFRIYNRALVPSEVEGLYKAGAARLKVNTPVGSGAAGLSSGLVGYWTFDGQDTIWSSGTTGTSTDKSGNNNNGTLTNMSRSSSPAIGKIGQALNFDGVDDYVNLGNYSSLKPSLPITVMAWIRVDTLAARGIFMNDSFNADGASNYYGVYLAVQSSGQIEVGYGDGNGKTVFNRRSKSSATAISTNRWYHIAAVISGATNMSIFIDGVDAGTGGYTGYGGSLAYSTAAGRIGEAVQDWMMYGLIDEVRIYNRALSADEILQLYQQGARKAQFRE